MRAPISAVVLDAMGVLYRAADDVSQLLVPFCFEAGCRRSANHIRKAYLHASLGRISADEFWRSLDLDPELESEYLARHALTPGLPEFLAVMHTIGTPVWCLSNDVPRWSVWLRRRFALEHSFAGFVISGEVGARKPEEAIFKMLLERVGLAPERILFVDDRAENVTAALKLGLVALQFRPPRHGATDGFEALRASIATATRLPPRISADSEGSR